MKSMTLNHPRPELACKIAGALAQSATADLTLHTPGKAPTPLTARTTDLPAILRDAPVGTRLLTPQGCIIEITASGCTIRNAGRELVQAMERIDR